MTKHRRKALAGGQTEQGLKNTNREICTTDSSATSVTSKQKNPRTGLQQKAVNIVGNGWPIIPIGSNGNPKPYGDGQKYGATMVSRDAAKFGVRLERAILLDYDGNKSSPMPVEELFEKMGIPMLEAEARSNAVQWRLKDGELDGSYHWLFRMPEGYDASSLKQSADGAFAGVDIKTGNQLIYIKDDKTLEGDKAMFGAKVRAVVLATNNEPMKMTERNGAFERKTGLEPEQLLAMSEECRDLSALSEDYIGWLEAHESAGAHNDIACELVSIIRKLEVAPRWGYAPGAPDTFARRMAHRRIWRSHRKRYRES